MIARIWRCRVPRNHAAGFEAHLAATGVAESAALEGHLGAQILRSDTTGPDVEFRLITYWSSWDAIRRFAGEDVDKAVLYPGDEQYELVPDPTVEHFVVTLSTY
jgi:heme-degrading monooxygenase HmoA